MTGSVENRLSALGISLPEPPVQVANYVPFVVSGNLVFVSGQISMTGAGPITGRLGDGLGVEEGQNAAVACALSLIAQLKAACSGDLEKVVRIVKLTGFVNCTPDFTDHPKVINGASDLFVEVFGDKGRHARVAVGSSSLPLGVAVEIEGIFEIA